jgi:hypothetical protein
MACSLVRMEYGEEEKARHLVLVQLGTLGDALAVVSGGDERSDRKKSIKPLVVRHPLLGEDVDVDHLCGVLVLGLVPHVLSLE